MVQTMAEVEVGYVGIPQVPKSAPATKTTALTSAPQDDTAPLCVEAAPTPTPANAAPTPTSVGNMPTLQGNASTIHIDAAPPSRNTDSFSASIDELFGDIEGGIGSEVTSPP
ncbi:unnamed protein product [Ilex paraguariensis]|uniref:Uncharacterized protein n=1 Tax=Ilex paraguariensis TaxID=185542 RepID=A0ABC8SY11_9AQUA